MIKEITPQKDAETLCRIRNLETIAKNGCCAFVYLWCLHIETDSIHAIEILDDAIRTGKLGDDCLVKWADFGTWITGRNIDIEFIDISDIKKIKDRTPVFYSTKKRNKDGSLPAGHWVGVENGKIAYDPIGLGNSINVENGKPITSRKIIIKGVK